jgi:hypothetical protein
MGSIADRFWSKVDKAPSSNGCWLWTATKDRRLYGRFWNDGNRFGAHRTAWELTRGPIPPGLYVLHHCDTPPCVNPEHLFIGTQTDNMRDMAAKGRASPIPARIAGLMRMQRLACKSGHLFTPENTGKRSRSSGGRFCRACDRAKQRLCRHRRANGGSNENHQPQDQ